MKDKLLFDSIEYVNTTYLSEELATYFSGLAWRFSTVQNKEVQVSLLLEHKSMVDKYIAFQVLEYIALGYRTQLKNKQQLELIIPIAYYHGNKRWEYRASTDFFDEISSDLHPFLPKRQRSTKG
ncbi:MAG: putative transposase YdaD [Spirosomataceae bacterium]